MIRFICILVLVHHEFSNDYSVIQDKLISRVCGTKTTFYSVKHGCQFLNKSNDMNS